MTNKNLALIIQSVFPTYNVKIVPDDIFPINVSLEVGSLFIYEIMEILKITKDANCKISIFPENDHSLSVEFYSSDPES